MKKYILLLFFSTLITDFVALAAIQFELNMFKYRTVCLSDYVNANSLFKVKITVLDGDPTSIMTTVADLDANDLTPDVLVGSTIFTYTPVKNGDMHVCMSNTGTVASKVVFEMDTKANLGEIFDVAKDSDFVQVNQHVGYLKTLFAQVKRLSAHSVKTENERLIAVDSVAQAVYIYTGITVIALIGMAYLQMKYLHRFFKNKKLI